MVAVDNNEQGQGAISEESSVGAQLKLAREKAGLSLGDVSTELLITRSKLTALESDNYEQLPAKVFVVGYIKKYADLLKLDEKPLINAYEINFPESDTDDDSFLVSEPLSKIKLDKNVFGRQQSPPKWIVPVGVFGVAFSVLLATMLFSGDKDSKSLKTPEKIKTIVDEIVVENNENLSSIKDVPVMQDEPVDESVGDVAAEGAIETEKLETEVENELLENVAAEQKEIDTLIFSFVEECWLHVKEVEGNVIYSGTAAAGSTVALDGRGPFELMVGNASAASLLVNGEPVSIDPQPGRKTAKLSVGG